MCSLSGSRHNKLLIWHISIRYEIWVDLLLWNVVVMPKGQIGQPIGLGKSFSLFPPGDKRQVSWVCQQLQLQEGRGGKGAGGRWHEQISPNLIYNIFESCPARSMQSSALFCLVFFFIFFFFSNTCCFLWHFSFTLFFFRFCRLFSKTFSLSFSICVFRGFAVPLPLPLPQPLPLLAGSNNHNNRGKRAVSQPVSPAPRDRQDRANWLPTWPDAWNFRMRKSKTNRTEWKWKRLRRQRQRRRQRTRSKWNQNWI